MERRIQEVIEQERREREMKERLLIEEGGAKGGNGNVGNSPRARLDDHRDEPGEGGEGATDGAKNLAADAARFLTITTRSPRSVSWFVRRTWARVVPRRTSTARTRTRAA